MTQQSTGERFEHYTADLITLEHLHRYALACQLVKDKIVLDLACGEGYGSFLLSAVAASVTGVDKDAHAVEKASSKYRKSNLAFKTGSVTALPVEGSSVDVVVSFETLEHVISQEEMIAEIRRVLKPGGLLIISTPDKKYYSEKPGHHNPFHLKELTRSEFASLLAGHFRKQRLLYQCSGLFSVILPQQGSGEPVSFAGDMSAVSKEPDFPAPFILILASDEFIPEVPPGVFQPGNIHAMMLKAQQDQIKGTYSYRLGHFLLSPFKFLRKVFRKNPGRRNSR